jgi:hypothetical protein
MMIPNPHDLSSVCGEKPFTPKGPAFAGAISSTQPLIAPSDEGASNAPCLQLQVRAIPQGNTMKIRRPKPDRIKIDLTEDAVARAWTKKLGKSREEIAAAIAKVGDNAETVKRELDTAEVLKK